MAQTDYKAGFYWAKTNESFKWWNLIVQIHGDPPFFKLTVWSRTESKIVERSYPDPDWVWGPRIEEPK